MPFKNPEHKALWRELNRDKEGEHARRHLERHPYVPKPRKPRMTVEERQQKTRQRNIIYRQANRIKLNDLRRVWCKGNLQNRIRSNLRRRLRGVIKDGRGGSAVRDLGCTIPEFKAYIEKKFLPGMTWDNYGYDGWHLDHKTPLAAFDLTDREEFLQACHYTNYQPLWSLDNLRKGAKFAWDD